MAGPACVPNIRARTRAARRRFGVGALGAAAVVAITAPALGLTPWSHVVVAMFVFGGCTGLLQSREHT